MTLTVDNPILNLRLPRARALLAVRCCEHTAAQRWWEAVSNWGEMGRWAFDQCGAPGLDLLLVGGPTHGSNPSPPMREFLDGIPQGTLAGVKVAAFDTRTDMDKLTGAMRLFGRFLDRLGYAAPKISSSLEKRGGQVVKPPEGFIVLGTEGPLEEGELERATQWARQIAGQVSATEPTPTSD